jgi:hypothetical protein
LEDDVKITITASSTCLGPVILVDYGNMSTSTLTINFSEDLQKGNSTDLLQSKTFAKTEINDVAVGNIYKKISYDIHGNGICYSLLLESHGANGAGLYVDDPVLVKKYDEQHLVDANNMMNIVYGILGSLQLRNIP